ncbi:hypothetical protein LOS78_01845 [Paracoccus sp. MA]|uniref:hypothetical protein n=1 Tax=Paracoccus sp. MA TaxID=2895796 RepID=UPI001E62BE6D|nr:hypothetical protein [Paracoccus sp. MA]UFM64242.1 hypothetical protein LOS78_01845 [Paracoccus sp. MA]
MPVTMKRTAAFLPLILPFCPECPDFLAEQHARFAAIEFCERSRAWRHLTTVSLPEGSAGVGVMVAPDTAAIHEIEFAEINGKKLTPVQFSTIGAAPEGRPEYITQTAPNEVRVLPFEPGSLEISVFLKPLTGSQYGTDPESPLFDRYNVVPDFLVDMHGATIAAGALAALLSIPDEPWTDKKEAAKYEARFREKLDSAFRWNMRGQQRAPIRNMSRWF